jgi:thermopsin
MAKWGSRGIGLAVFVAFVMALSSSFAAVAVQAPLAVSTTSGAGLSEASTASASLPAAANGVPALPLLPSTFASPAAYQEAESELEAHYSAIAAQLTASGVPANLIHLPSTEPAEIQNGHVVSGPEVAAQMAAETPSGTAAPVPSGIAYYGESGSDASPTKTTMDTTSLRGTLNVTNLTTLYLDTGDPDQWGAQQNAIVNNVTLGGSDGYSSSAQKNGYAFWTQDVIGYQNFNDTVQFDENTWNFTDSAESFPASGTSTVVANDTNDTLYDDGEVYAGESHFFYAPEPFNLTLYTNLSLYNPLICNQWSSVHSSSVCSTPSVGIADYAGDQTLFYNYSITFPSSNTKVAPGTKYSGNFDWLTFHTAKGSVYDDGANTQSAGFEASGGANEEIGLSNDWELEFGIGAYDGANQDDLSGSGTATLSYLSDCTHTRGSAASCTIPKTKTYKSIPAALNWGSQTGEDSEGMNINFVSNTVHRATFQAGPLNMHGLWGYSSQAGINPGQVAVTNNIRVSGSPLTLTSEPYIFVFLEDTSVTTPAAGYTWAPDVPTWYLMPGTYDYEAMLADYTEQTGSFTVTSGTPTTVTATLPYATSNGVYTPLWAVAPNGNLANAKLAGISTAGAGTLSSQYVLFDNNDTASSAALNSVFEAHDDYDFPTFAGLLLWNTTAYVEDNKQIEFYTGSSTYGYLQQQLYETQHVTVEHTVNILGWAEQTSLFESTASQNPIPTANLMVWNSTNDLVKSNTFEGEKAHSSSFVAQDDLLFYGGGSECSQADNPGPGPAVTAPCGGTSGPAPAGSQNVVWGNELCDAACTTTPSVPGTYAGIAEAESGDLIYNNYFKVDNPAPLMPWNLQTETGPVYYHDTWNVPE